MSTVQHAGNLELDQDIEFQRRSWTVQRIGWGILAIGLIAAVAGLFGGGPISNGTAGDEGASLRVRYPRFARLMAPTTLQMELGPEAVTGDNLRVWLDQEFIQSVQLQQITPEPDRVEAGSDGLTYVFSVAEPSQPMTITLYIEPQQVGTVAGRIGIENGSAQSFTSFIYP